MYDWSMTTIPARTRVLEALMNIIAEQGLDQVTIRAVASAADVSIGTVQYYCRSKDEMLEMAFNYVIDSSLDRVDAIPRGGDVGAVMRIAMREFMPLDDRRRRETRVYLAFAARAVVEANLAVVQHDIMVRLRTMCADAFRVAAERGQTFADAEADLFGASTVALLDGLNLHLLADPAGLSMDAATAIADEHIGRYFKVADASANR